MPVYYSPYELGEPVAVQGHRRTQPYYWFTLGNGRVALAVYENSVYFHGWYPLVVDVIDVRQVARKPARKLPAWMR